MLLAHGIGTRADLPVPAALAAAGAVAGRSLPAGVARVIDHPVLRTALRLVTLLAAGFVVVVGLAGPDSVALNLAPWVFYITFWVGLVPASLLLGPVWRVLNPLRLLHGVLARLVRADPETGWARLPAVVGYWPAAVSLGVFAWFELVYPARAEPVHVAWFMVGYAVVHTGAGVVFGRGWFAHGDGFEVYSTLLGALAPVGRRADGRLVLRNPFDGLAAVRAAPGLVAVVVVLVGTTAYDGLARTSWWLATLPEGTANATLALLCSVLLIGVVYLLGTWRLVAPSGGADGPGPEAFAHTIVPIAAGYAIAHYFSLLVLDGQQAVILASDPFGTGADLLGTAGRVTDYTVLGTTTIAVVQVGAIVAGHVVAAISAHDRAVALFPPRAALRTQYPLLAAMVALTVGAVGLVFSA